MSTTFDRRHLLRTAVAGGVLAAGAAGCSAEAPSGAPGGAPGAATAPSGTPGRVLLAYFSRAGENYHDGGRRDLEVGNTERLAAMITAVVDCDVYRIEAADPYPDSYDETVARNGAEQRAEARPAIAQPLPDAAAYETVLLGSPIWNVRPPRILLTLVEQLDLTGRTVLPFVTHAVSGLGRTVEDYTAAAPGAVVGPGLAVRGEDVGAAADAVDEWVARVLPPP